MPTVDPKQKERNPMENFKKVTVPYILSKLHEASGSIGDVRGLSIFKTEEVRGKHFLLRGVVQSPVNPVKQRYFNTIINGDIPSSDLDTYCRDSIEQLANWWQFYG